MNQPFADLATVGDLATVCDNALGDPAPIPWGMSQLRGPYDGTY